MASREAVFVTSIRVAAKANEIRDCVLTPYRGDKLESLVEFLVLLTKKLHHELNDALDARLYG